jgi:probable F420-dependent oxidoreductase
MATHRPFRFGVTAAEVLSRAEWVEYARKVEALGYSTLVMGEHLGFLSAGSLGPFAALMAAADATTTLRLGSHVFANDFRHPALLAQEAATIDLLSDGRLELGLGAGWLHTDYDIIGMPFDAPAVRIDRLEEAIGLIKRLFGDAPVTFAGRYYQVQDMNLFPKPRQLPHPPFFIGGGGRRALRLAAREASIVGMDTMSTPDGTKDFATTTAEAIAQRIDWVREAAGMRFPELEIHALIHAVKVTDDRRQGAAQLAAELASWPATVVTNATLSPEQILASPRFLIGTIEQIIADVQERRERYGITYLTVFGEYIDTFSPVVARLAGSS